MHDTSETSEPMAWDSVEELDAYNNSADDDSAEPLPVCEEVRHAVDRAIADVVTDALGGHVVVECADGHLEVPSEMLEQFFDGFDGAHRVSRVQLLRFLSLAEGPDAFDGWSLDQVEHAALAAVRTARRLGASTRWVARSGRTVHRLLCKALGVRGQASAQQLSAAWHPSDPVEWLRELARFPRLLADGAEPLSWWGVLRCAWAVAATSPSKEAWEAMHEAAEAHAEHCLLALPVLMEKMLPGARQTGCNTGGHSGGMMFVNGAVLYKGAEWAREHLLEETTRLQAGGRELVEAMRRAVYGAVV